MTKSELDQFIHKYGESNKVDKEGKPMNIAMNETERIFKYDKSI